MEEKGWSEEGGGGTGVGHPILVEGAFYPIKQRSGKRGKTTVKDHDIVGWQSETSQTWEVHWEQEGGERRIKESSKIKVLSASGS